ncbi:MAG: hypothetical protein Q8926_06180 [Bacteroidota bacterium]|nr:hypothetical protein [Bacteroidota bacterium]
MRKSLLLCLTAGLFLISCKKDSYIGGSNALLTFSSDSVYFDTVFASARSITQQVRVFNPNDQKLRISDISLMGGKNSPFILNINGSPGPSAADLTLDANDSLYLFISVFISPNAQPNAFILEDSIRIRCNGAERFIKLSAWGQNAHFLNNQVIQGNITWNNDLPYVISGSLRVDSISTLTIQPGCRVYFHANAPLLVDGTLRVQGEAADSLRVYFNGDRLDEPYASFPDAWPGIYFSESSLNNVLEYAILLNGYQSLVAEGPSINASPKLRLNQCIINNSLDAGVYGIQSSIDATNCLISNCGKNIVIATGGTYHFIQCTVASFSTPVLLHQQPLLTVSDAGTVGSQFVTEDLQAIFTNCIFWGDTGISDEALISRQGNGAFQVLFDHAILKQQNYPANIDSMSLFLNTDPLFLKTDNRLELYDFHLQAGSPALAQGKDLGIGVDLDGFARQPGNQDLGCYERQ